MLTKQKSNDLWSRIAACSSERARLTCTSHLIDDALTWEQRPAGDMLPHLHGGELGDGHPHPH
jgi:hypothetical protein